MLIVQLVIGGLADEYPYLAGSDRAVSSVLQAAIDHYQADSKLFLILCGSSMSFANGEIHRQVCKRWMNSWEKRGYFLLIRRNIISYSPNPGLPATWWSRRKNGVMSR